MCTECGGVCPVCGGLPDGMVLSDVGWVLFCAEHRDPVVRAVVHQDQSRANAWLN